MSTLNASPVTPADRKPLVMRTLTALATAGAGALAVVMGLAFLPSNFVSQILGPLLPDAVTGAQQGGQRASSPHTHRLDDALHAQHGTFVSDPYGCLYVFQYLDATLSLTPVRDEHRQQVCRRPTYRHP